MRDARIRPQPDACVAAWIGPALLGWDAIDGMAVGSVVPTGFAAYARVLHPVPGAWDATAGSVLPPELVTWADVCATSGATAHPPMQWVAICAGWPGGDPSPGRLEPDVLASLVECLPWTADVTYAVWEGWGGLIDDHSSARLTADGGRSAPAALSPATQRGSARLSLPHRGYLLFTGPLLPVTQWADDPDAVDLGQSASLFWPADRSWCVATEIDVDSTLVGASREVIDAILAAEYLEAYEVDILDDLSVRGDRINDR